MSDFDRMHRQNSTTKKLREQIFEYAAERMDFDPVPLDSPKTPDELFDLAGQTLTESGLGGEQALEIFREILAPATISTDHPNYLSFIPAAPTEAASLFDLVVSASSIYGGSWMEGAGAVYAENQVLKLLAAECGLPNTAGGVFVQGGTLGNLSALVVAREQAKKRFGEQKFAILCSSESHSSIKSVAKVMGVQTLAADAGESGSIGRIEIAAAHKAAIQEGLVPFAVVGTAGTTNFGILDNLEELAAFAKEESLWFHVDGAYGLAGILSPSNKHLYKGVEHADSFIVDPHKWLYAPFDACALVYRNPELAREVHTQHGEYLETLNESGDYNPSDYAFNLTRRVRGLPLWFSLATHGIAAYREAVAANIDLAKRIANEISNRDYLNLVRGPQLSVVVFERIGWSQKDYDNWSAQLLAAGFAFVVPSSHKGKPNTRFAIVNPRTKFEDLVKILESMR